MSTKTIKRNKTKLIWILIAAVLITAIIPLSARGSEGATATVQFKIDGQVYGEKMKVPVGNEDAKETDAEENEELGITKYYLDSSQYPDDPEKEGYNFVGWSDGTTIYTKNSKDQLPLTIGADVSLEAVFEENSNNADNQTDSAETSDSAISTEEPDKVDPNNDKPEKQTNETNINNKGLKNKNLNTVPEHTVTFYSQNKKISQQKISEGTAVAMPENPEIPDNMSAFKGWYTNTEGQGEQYDFSSKITKDINLFAVFTDKYIVLFKDADGAVLESQEVSNGEYVKAPSQTPDPRNENDLFQYWYVEGSKGTEAFDFAKEAVYSNITLVPKFNDSYYVFFDSYDENISTQTVPKGENAKIPDTPVRDGYKFAFWSKDATASYKDTDKAYDFELNVNESFTLYGIWEGEKTGYSVVFWTENANIDGDPGTDKANYTYTDKVNVPKNNSSYLSGMTLNEDEIKKVAQNHYSSKAAGSKALKYSEFGFAPNVTLKGDGTSVINVYYKRIVFTGTINLNRNNTYLTMNDIDYRYGQSNYTFTSKYEQNIIDRFPADNVVTDEAGTHVIDGWNCPNNITGSTEQPHSAVRKYPEYMIPWNYASGARNFNITATWMPENNSRYMWRQTYLTLTTEEQNALGGNISEIPEMKNLSDSNFPDSGSQPPEYVRIGNTVYKWYPDNTMEGYDNKGKSVSAYNHGSFTGAVQANNGNGANRPSGLTRNTGNTEAILWYMYARNNVNLSLDLQGGNLDGTKTWSVTFGDNAANALKKAYGGKLPEPNYPGKDMHFDGWHLDSTYHTKLTEDTTVPSNGLILYAKYREGTNRVNFYDKVGGSLIENISGTYGKGVNVTDPEIYDAGTYYDGLGKFVGWGYRPSGTTMIKLYDFEKLTVNSDLDLYGIWITDDFRVTYNTDNLDDTAPVDNDKYKLNVDAPVKDIISGENSNGIETEFTNVFAGWQADGYGPIYYPGSSVKISNNVNFKAVYATLSNMTTITYKANYEDSNDNVTDKVIIGKEAMLRGSDTFNRAGYKLIGWSTNSDSTIADYNFNEPVIPGSDPMTLHAVWEKVKTYNVTFKIADGQEAMGSLSNGDKTDVSSITYEVEENSKFADIKWPEATANENYEFVGWDPAQYNDLYVESELTFTASFKKNVKIDLGTIKVDDNKKVYGDKDPKLTYNIGYDELDTEHFDIEAKRVQGEDAGTYDINLSIRVKAEYEDEYTVTGDIKPGKFTIEKRPVTLTAKSYPQGEDVIYSTGILPKFEANIDDKTPLVSGDALDYTLKIKDYNGEGTPSPGKYEIVFDIDKASDANKNYDINTIAGTLTITEPETTDPTTTPGVLEPTINPEDEGELAGPGTSNPSGDNTNEASGGTTDNTAVAGDSSAASRAISDGLVPSTSIGDTDVPLYSKGLFDSWALINLILAVAGGLLALITIIRSMFRKNRRDEEERLETDEENTKYKKTRLWLMIASAISAIGGIVLFILTQDITQTMVLVDMWTAVNAVLFAITVVSMIFISKKHKHDDSDRLVTQ